MPATTVSDIVAAADRLAKLGAIKARWEAVEPEYRELQQQFRDIAGGRSLQFPGTNGVLVGVEQKPDSVCRVVIAEDLPSVIRWSGDHVFDLFSLHPSRGSERNFDLNALKLRPKRDAVSLIGRLKRASTAVVRLLSS
jgi:hypothetical protein